MNACRLLRRLGRRLPLGAFLSLLPVTAQANGVSAPDWAPLLANDLPRAIREFRAVERDFREVRDHRWALAANGRALALWSVGEYMEASEVWMDLCEWCIETPEDDSPLRTTPFLEGYLACLRRASEHVRIDGRLTALLERLLPKGEEPDKSRLIGEFLFDLYRYAGDTRGLQRLAGDLGLVARWDSVVGPFGYSDYVDLEEVFDPEKDPNAAAYAGYYGDVVWRKVPAESPDGFLDVGALIYPARGLAYARAALDAAAPVPGLLTVESRNSLRVWWNGRLVLSRDRGDLDLETRTTVPIEVLGGRNSLLVKTLKEGGAWGHRVLVYSSDPALRLEIAPADADRYPPCHPDNRRFLAPRRPHVLESIDPRSTRGDLEIVDLLAGIYAAELGRRDRRYEAAQEYLERVLLAAPGWCLPQTLLGYVSWEAAGDRPGSETRLETEARAAFQAALEASPVAVPAAVGLGEYFRARKTFDTALSTLEKAQVDLAAMRKPAEGDASPLLRHPIPALDEALGRTYEDLEYDIEAQRAYGRALEGSGADPEAWVRLSKLLARAHAGRESFTVAEEGNRLFPADAALLRQLVSAAETAGAEEEILPVLTRRLALGPLDLGIAALAAGIFEKLSHTDEALRAYESMKSICPADPLPYARHGDYLLRMADTTSAADASRLAQAVEQLRLASEREPQNIDLRRRIHTVEKTLAELAGKPLPPGTKSLLDEYYDIDYFSLDQSRLVELPREKANAVYLLDLMVKSLFPNGTGTSVIHQAVLLRNKEGRDQFSEISVPRDAEILVARTIIPGGTVYHAETITDTGSDQSISMYGLEDGCVVDYAYRMTSAAVPPPGREFDAMTFYFGEVTNPMLLSRLVLLVPGGVDVQWRAHPLEFAPRIEDGSACKVWTWERTLSPGVKQESNMPPQSLIVPTVKITTCPDWSIGAKQARGWLKGRRENEGTLAEVASLLALDVATPPEKIAKVFEYIQRVIEPGNFGGGTVIDTLKNRAGSSFDKVMLAHVLLEHMGVRTVIAAGYDPGAEKRFSPVPSTGYLARPLLLVPGGSEPDGEAFVHPRDLWVSFASRYLSFGELQSSDRSQLLFLYPPRGVALGPPLDDDVAGGYVERHLDFTLVPDADSACGGSFFYHGDIRAGLRRAVADQALRERLQSAEITRTVRGIEVESSEFTGVQELGDNLTIRFRGKVNRMLQPREDGWSLDPVLAKSDLSASVREPEREQPVRFDEPVVYNPYRAAFRLPPPPDGPEAVFSHVPGDTVLISRFGAFVLDFELEGDTLWVTRSAYVPAQWIEPEDYAEFIEFCRGVDAAETERVIIRPAEAGAGAAAAGG